MLPPRPEPAWRAFTHGKGPRRIGDGVNATLCPVSGSRGNLLVNRTRLVLAIATVSFVSLLALGVSTDVSAATIDVKYEVDSGSADLPPSGGDGIVTSGMLTLRFMTLGGDIQPGVATLLTFSLITQDIQILFTNVPGTVGTNTGTDVAYFRNTGVVTDGKTYRGYGQTYGPYGVTMITNQFRLFFDLTEMSGELTLDTAMSSNGYADFVGREVDLVPEPKRSSLLAATVAGMALLSGWVVRRNVATRGR